MYPGWIKLRFKRGVGRAVPTAAAAKLPKKKRVKKDPNAPKKAKSAYIFFCAVKRPQMVASNPIGISHGDLTKMVSAAWKELPAEEKKQFEELSATDKERYVIEMQAYTPPDDIILAIAKMNDGNDSDNSSSASAKKRKREGASKKKKKDPNAPKKAMSAYIIFSAAKRIELKETQPELDFNQTAVEMGKQWRELSDEDKVQWNEKSAVSKARYEKEMEGYTPPADLVMSDDNGGGSKASKKKKKDPNAPKKAMSAYMIFSAAKRIELKETQPELYASQSQTAAETGKQWRELSDEDKVQWNEKSAVSKARYEKEMEGYTPPADLVMSDDNGGGSKASKKKKQKKDKNARE
jgi:hypothetical protein